MPENADTTTTPEPLTFRTPDRKHGPWTDLPVGWTQEEQPKGSGIWRRYRPLPKAKKARAAEQKRRRDHRYTAQNERTNFTLRPVVQGALDTVRAHLLVKEGRVCSEQRLIGRLAFTAASHLNDRGRLTLFDLPEDKAQPGRPGKKLIGAVRASEVPDDDSDLHDETVVRFVGSRAEEIAVLAEEEGLHPNEFMQRALSFWGRTKSAGRFEVQVGLDLNAQAHAERCMEVHERKGGTLEELVAALLLKESERLDDEDERLRRQEDW